MSKQKITKTPFTITGFINDDLTESATWMKDILLDRIRADSHVRYGSEKLKLKNIAIKIHRKKLLLNATCVECNDDGLRTEMDYRQYHNDSCERCPDGKCACIKKLKWGWFHKDCGIDEVCCRYIED